MMQIVRKSDNRERDVHAEIDPSIIRAEANFTYS